MLHPKAVADIAASEDDVGADIAEEEQAAPPAQVSPASMQDIQLQIQVELMVGLQENPCILPAAQLAVDPNPWADLCDVRPCAFTDVRTRPWHAVIPPAPLIIGSDGFPTLSRPRGGLTTCIIGIGFDNVEQQHRNPR